MFDLEAHLKRQMAFSRATFGPGARTKGISNHILKEIKEVETAEFASEEWIDILILALDGLTRALLSEFYEYELTPGAVCDLLEAKQAANELRDWPSWRDFSQDQPIEHIREGE